MKRKKKDVVAEPQSEDMTPAVSGDAGWDGPTRAGEEGEIAELAAESARTDLGLAGSEESSVVTGEPAAETAGEASAEPVSEAASDELSDAPPEISLEALAESLAHGSPDAEGEALAADGAVDGALDGALDATVDGALDAAADVALDDGELPEPPVESAGRLESILESLLYAADRPLSVADLKKLVNERDTKKLTTALEALRERRAETGIQLASLAGGWQFRTHPDNGLWVAKLIAGKPQRLSRAMLEALAIVAYRQPITRPEIDEIRGVDCGPVLKTLLERGFIRIVGKKEDVGRPMLYGTTPDFLRTFSLRDLSELPTLREFHELSEQQMATVDAQAPLPEGASAPPAPSPFAPTPMDLTPVDTSEEEELLDALDNATSAAARASGPPPGQEQPAVAETQAASESSEAQG